MLKKLIKKHNSRRMTNARPAAKCYSQLRQIKSHQDECLASQATETVADTAYLAFGVRVSRWAKCFTSWKPGDGIFCISFFFLFPSEPFPLPQLATISRRFFFDTRASLSSVSGFVIASAKPAWSPMAFTSPLMVSNVGKLFTAPGPYTLLLGYYKLVR